MALDCALYDLAAQLNDVPLFEYLGGHSHEVRTDVTLSAVVAASSLRDALEFAQGFVNDGVRTLKCKVGAGGDDVATLLQLRKALGPDVALRIDANQGWSPQQAVAIINDLQEAGVNLEFAEQPVARDDIDAMAFVTRHVQTPIMADETVWNRRNLREIVRTHAADMINVKLAKTGGLREARELVALAHKHDVAVIIGCMAESHVGISAAAALASLADATTLDSAIAHDLDGGLLLTRSPVEGGVSYDADRVILPSSPGTGITALSVE
jgi:L-alanine-DL-glutamate epimerase-like enolase superfamily enzyme